MIDILNKIKNLFTRKKDNPTCISEIPDQTIEKPRVYCCICRWMDSRCADPVFKKCTNPESPCYYGNGVIQAVNIYSNYCQHGEKRPGAEYNKMD
jgi:hypothetical protein